MDGRPIMVVVGAHFLLRCLDLERFVLYVVKVSSFDLAHGFVTAIPIVVPRILVSSFFYSILVENVKWHSGA